MNPVPITLRQLPRFFLQVLRREMLARKATSARARFKICYFSCRPHFRLLYCSLHSLYQLKGLDFRVVVFNDNSQPLSHIQERALQALSPGITIIDWPRGAGWGATQIHSIWRAYRLAASDMLDEDVLVKIDSDVFFLNSRIFAAVRQSRAALVGDGHYVGFRYCQGGCYFLRASAIRKIGRMLDQSSLEQLLGTVEVMAEDLVAFRLAQKAGLGIWQTWFMMFPDELRNAGRFTRWIHSSDKRLTNWQRWKFSCIHFVLKNKDLMLTTYEDEVLSAAQKIAYHASIADALGTAA